MQTLGDILRLEREKQGISVKDVEKGTSIRALYIQAIEDGNYGILPGEVYRKGFIRNYANFLNLNGQEMVDLYRTSQAPVATTSAEPAKKEPAKKERKNQAAKKGTSGKWLTALAILLLFVGVTWLGVSFWSAPPPSTPPAKPAPQAQVNPVPAPPAVPQKPATPAAPAGRPVVIVAKFSAPSWTLVTADGKEVYEGTPKLGESHTWSADRSITLRVGNAYGVDVTYNGQPQGKMGSDGEVVEKTFSATVTNIQKP